MTLRLSRHAQQRAREMGIPTKEVKRALEHPDAIEYPGRTPHVRIVMTDRLALPYDPDTGTVITVLWKGEFERGEPRGDVRLGPEG